MAAFLAFFVMWTSHAAEIGGIISRATDGTPVANVRVTLFRLDLRFFREVRTGAEGRYSIAAVRLAKIYDPPHQLMVTRTERPALPHAA